MTNSKRLFDLQDAIKNCISKINKTDHLDRYQVYLLNNGKPIKNEEKEVKLKCLISKDFGISKSPYEITIPKNLYLQQIKKPDHKQIKFQKL